MWRGPSLFPRRAGIRGAGEVRVVPASKRRPVAAAGGKISPAAVVAPDPKPSLSFLVAISEAPVGLPGA